MAATRDILRNYNLFVDGRSYAGQIAEFQPPTLTVVTEDFRAGGMDAPEAIDMGMEPLEASFVLLSHDADVMALTGTGEGGSIQLQARGALQSVDGTLRAEIHTMRGHISSKEHDAYKAGEASNVNFTVKLHYYKVEIDGRVLHEIDIRNMVRVVDGVDRVEGIRRIIGA